MNIDDDDDGDNDDDDDDDGDDDEGERTWWHDRSRATGFANILFYASLNNYM